MNLVCSAPGVASAVLLRAGEVVAGVELAGQRRGGVGVRELARGPARLTVALGVGRDVNGVDACAASSELAVFRRQGFTGPVVSGPRVGVAAGGETPWRFWLDGDPTVSAYRGHVRRRR
jgi:DNA-3-methyladenine glycosylase